ncbi:MAG TPA: hypothetical protein VFM35_06615 [Candidatus Binatia bacterium]|nr:hypothetical protein [Candidatus Binatia bacterium]
MEDQPRASRGDSSHASIKVSFGIDRCGEVHEIVRDLSILEEVYNNLYAWELLVAQAELDSQEGTHYRGLPKQKLSVSGDAAEVVPNEDRLCLAQIEIIPPAFVEIVGSPNPLHALRRYLMDRHVDWDRKRREPAEDKRLALEDQRIDVVRDKVGLLRELGFPEIQIREALSRHVFAPLDRLDSCPNIGPFHEDEKELLRVESGKLRDSQSSTLNPKP